MSENLLNQPISLHIFELRRRLQISLLSYLLACILCYYFAGNIYAFLVKPLADIYQSMGVERRLIFTGLAEAFFTYIKIACFAAFILSFPVIAWQVYFFIAPGLFKNEKKVVLPFLILAPLLFIIGASLAYFYVMPLAWRFFIGFENSSVEMLGLPIILEARISEYLSLVISLIIAFGIAFQLPLILTLLTYTGIITGAFLAKGRRYAIVLIFLLAAILTPPDVISQIALAIPLMLLYEISILICNKIAKSRIN